MKPSAYLHQEQILSPNAATHPGMVDQEKAVVGEFIMCYKNNRVLWDSKFGRNVTRVEKDEIFSELARILGKIKNNCTVDDVKKKINALRSNYRRELRKVRRSEALARENKVAVFQPTLWWYELMGFLEEVERPFDDFASSYKFNCNLDEMKTETNSKKRKCGNNKPLPLIVPTYNNDIPAYNPTQAMQNFVDRCESNITDSSKTMHIFKEEREDTNNTPMAADCLQEMHVGDNSNKCAMNGTDNSNGYHSLAANITNSNMARNFQAPHSTNDYVEDSYAYKLPDPPSRELGITTGDCDTYFYLAHLWANKLRHVEPRQRLYAEKAINDIIFEAELGTLNRNSVRINET